MMDGVQFVTDEKGPKVAVQIDLGKYGELWDDISLARQRAGEPRETLETVRECLKKHGKIERPKKNRSYPPRFLVIFNSRFILK
jgi:hypothetical protein